MTPLGRLGPASSMMGRAKEVVAASLLLLAASTVWVTSVCGAPLHAARRFQPSALLLAPEDYAVSAQAPRRRLSQEDFTATCPNGTTDMALILRWHEQTQFAGYIAAKAKGFYHDKCLEVTIDPGPTEITSLNGTSYDWSIPWFLDWLAALDNGSHDVHAAQIFTRPGWRYFRLPSNDTSTIIENFGDMRDRVTFGVPEVKPQVPDATLASLLLQYNKTYCGMGILDVLTGKPRPCRGGEDIELQVYKYVEDIITKGMAFAQGMIYNEINRLLIKIDGKDFRYTTNDPQAPNNIFIYDPAAVDKLPFPEDGLIVSSALWTKEGTEPSISAFVEATIRGWIFCRDNAEECVDMIATDDGNANQQQQHTLQIMQINEVNKLIWPAIRGIGSHSFPEMAATAVHGAKLGILDKNNQFLKGYGDYVAETMMEAVQRNLTAEGLDIYGQEVSPVKICVGEEGVAVVCASNDQGKGSNTGLILGLAIGIPLFSLLVVLVLVYVRSIRLEQKLKALREENALRSLDLEAPIMKVINLLRKLDEADVRLTPELSEELTAVRRVLAQSSNLNMPDIGKQLKLFESSEEHSSELLAFLLNSATYANGLETAEINITTRSNSGLSNASSRVVAKSSASFSAATISGRLNALLKFGNQVQRSMSFSSVSHNRELVQRSMSSTTNTNDMYNFLVAVHPEADDLMQSVGIDPCLDMLTFAGISNSQVLVTVVLHIFQTVFNLVQSLRLDHYKLVNFITALEEGMNADQYHNKLHAADVVSRLSAILRMSRLFESTSNTAKRELAAALIASIIPAYEHPGRTNEFLIRTQSSSAVRFNQQHVLQNSAVHKCLKILKDPECNFICNWTEPQQRHFYAIVIELVLNSDVSSHFDLLTRFQIRVMASNEGGVNAQALGNFLEHQDRASRLLMLQMAMTCAIHGTALLPVDVGKKWMKRLQKEHHQQGEEEHRLRIPLTPLMDSTKQGIASMRAQAGWIDIIVLPAFNSFCCTFLACQPLLDRIRQARIIIGQEAIQGREPGNSARGHLRGGMIGVGGRTAWSHRSSSSQSVYSNAGHARTSSATPSVISPPASSGPSASELSYIMNQMRSSSYTRRPPLPETTGLTGSSMAATSSRTASGLLEPSTSKVDLGVDEKAKGIENVQSSLADGLAGSSPVDNGMTTNAEASNMSDSFTGSIRLFHSNGSVPLQGSSNGDVLESGTSALPADGHSAATAVPENQEMAVQLTAIPAAAQPSGSDNII